MPGDPSTKGKIVLLLSGVFTFIFRSIVKQSSRSEILCQSVKVCSRFNARLFLVVVNMAFAFLLPFFIHSFSNRRSSHYLPLTDILQICQFPSPVECLKTNMKNRFSESYADFNKDYIIILNCNFHTSRVVPF